MIPPVSAARVSEASRACLASVLLVVQLLVRMDERIVVGHLKERHAREIRHHDLFAVPGITQSAEVCFTGTCGV